MRCRCRATTPSAGWRRRRANPMWRSCGHADQQDGAPLRKVYDQMPEPRYVIPWAPVPTAEAITNIPAGRALRPHVPVDIYVPGCPPTAEARCLRRALL